VCHSLAFATKYGQTALFFHQNPTFGKDREQEALPSIQHPLAQAVLGADSPFGCSMLGVGSCSSIHPIPAAPAKHGHRKITLMLHYALVFLVVALIAGVLGFGFIAGTAAYIAKILFIVFLVLFIISFIGGRRGPVA